MDTRTGEIRHLGPGDEPGPNEVALTQEQAEAMRRLAPGDRPDSFAVQVELLAKIHPAAPPDGLSGEEWQAQKNAAKRIRRERRGK